MAAKLSPKAGAPAGADPVVPLAVAERKENATEEVAVDGKEATADDSKEAKVADHGTVTKPEDEKETKPEDTDPNGATMASEVDENKTEKDLKAADDGKETEPQKEATDDGKEMKQVTDERKEKMAEKAADDGKKAKPEKEAAPSIDKSSSFREESNFLSDLKESEKKALVEFRAMVEEAILANKLHKKEFRAVVAEAILANKLQKKPEEPNPKEKQEKVEEKQATHESKVGEKAKPEEVTEAKPEEAAHGEVKETTSEESALAVSSSDDKGGEKPHSDAQENENGDEKAKLEQASEAKAEPAAPDSEPAAAANAKQSTLEEDNAAPLEEKAVEACDKEVSLWGVPLLPSKGAEGTDVILLKFLRARDFKVKEAFELLQSVLQWRKENKVDSILEEESLGADLEAACYIDGVDRMGHPICYNISGVFDNDELYSKTFGTEEAREKFIRWTVKLMEQAVKKLDLKPGSATSLMQITDLKDAPGPSKKELRSSLKQVVQLLQDNYPEFVARNIFINVPFWYYAFNAIVSPFLTQRTKSKFIFARPANVSETLLKYIPAEAIPVRYGGLKYDTETEFSEEDGNVTELIAKSSSTTTIEIPTPEGGTTFLWDVNVLGWEVNYKEEFVPTDEASYTVLVRKSKKMGAQEGPLRNSFKNREPGKITLIIENNTYWKKKVLYRYKMKSSAASATNA